MRTPIPRRSRAQRLRVILLSVAVLVVGGNAAVKTATRHQPGCDYYRPVSGRVLIAHAGGGLPDRKYPNSIAALDQAYAHGLRSFEIDFHLLSIGGMRTGHDTSDLLDPRGAWLSEVLDWLRRHPDSRLLVDLKTDNLAGLRHIAALAPDLRPRIVPFIYRQADYAAVRSLGFAKPIYALFHQEEADWLTFANSHDFAAVAVHSELIERIPEIRHPAIVFTYDVMVRAPGASAVITNCMVPATLADREDPGRRGWSLPSRG